MRSSPVTTSTITCAVWAGFDKPQKIYRGAFGRLIALPVWVDVMNASVARYPPQEFGSQPACRRSRSARKSGLLATDKCYDCVRSASGDTVKRHTTYGELATKEQMPTDPATSMATARTLRAQSPRAGVPRAALAVDTEGYAGHRCKGPTLLAEKILTMRSARPPNRSTAEKEGTRREPALDPRTSRSSAPNRSIRTPDEDDEVRGRSRCGPRRAAEELLLQTNRRRPYDFGDD